MLSRRNGGMFFVSEVQNHRLVLLWFDFIIPEVSTFCYCTYVCAWFFYRPLNFFWPTASLYLFLIFFVVLYLSLPFFRIEVREIGGRKVIVFSQQQDEDTTVATIIIRASTEHVLNDVEVRTYALHQIFIQHWCDWYFFEVTQYAVSECLWVGQNPYYSYTVHYTVDQIRPNFNF